MTSLCHLKWWSPCLPPTSIPIDIRSAWRTACCWLLCWLLANALLANGTAKGPAKMLAGCYGLLLCFGNLSFALVLLKHAMVANASGSGCLLYKLVCLKFNSLSKYHAEPPTLTRLGASADFLSIELK